MSWHFLQPGHSRKYPVLIHNLGGGFKQHQHGAFAKTGGFKYVLFSPLFGEDFQFDEHIFQMGGSTTNQ